METHIDRMDENGDAFNRFGQRVIQCKYGCGRRTTMTGTKQCDNCWCARTAILGMPVEVLARILLDAGFKFTDLGV